MSPVVGLTATPIGKLPTGMVARMVPAGLTTHTAVGTSNLGDTALSLAL
jgi:hypothetical protein